MTSPHHGILQPNEDGIHTPHQWSVADEAARLALADQATEFIEKYLYQQDTQSVYILTSVGPNVWKLVGGNNLGELLDVTITTPSDGQYLVYQSGSWINQTFTQALDDLSDVDVPTPTDGYVLTWINANNAWEAAAASVVNALNDLSDVTIATPSTSDTLVYDTVGAEWVNAAILTDASGNILVDASGNVLYG